MPNGNGGPPPRPGGPAGAKPPMKKSTRNWLLIGGVGAAAIIAYMIMKSRSANASSAQAQEGIDPATGVPYSAEGGSAAYGATPSLYGYTDPSTGAFITGAGSSGSGGYVTAPSTNASWAQQVEAYLMNIGYDPQMVAGALGHYLTGTPLSSDEAGVVAAAKGFFGTPPQGAPPQLIAQPTGNSGDSTSGQNSTVQKFKTLTVHRAMTFAEMAKEWNWTPQTIAAIMKINNINAGSNLAPGEKLVRPWPPGKSYNL